MIQLKNAKVKFEGDKLLLIDAPEEPDVVDGCDDTIEEQWENYERKLSKAPTWEIKNRDEVKRFILKDIDPNWNVIAFQSWQPEQGKLYDIPKGYTYKFEPFHSSEVVEQRNDSRKAFAELVQERITIAILIPQEEVKEET